MFRCSGLVGYDRDGRQPDDSAFPEARNHVAGKIIVVIAETDIDETEGRAERLAQCPAVLFDISLRPIGLHACGEYHCSINGLDAAIVAYVGVPAMHRVSLDIAPDIFAAAGGDVIEVHSDKLVAISGDCGGHLRWRTRGGSFFAWPRLWRGRSWDHGRRRWFLCLRGHRLGRGAGFSRLPPSKSALPANGDFLGIPRRSAMDGFSAPDLGLIRQYRPLPWNWAILDCWIEAAQRGAPPERGWYLGCGSGRADQPCCTGGRHLADFPLPLGNFWASPLGLDIGNRSGCLFWAFAGAGE
jgi:hypothetical protein